MEVIMEENEDFMPSDQDFFEAEIYLFELQLREEVMLPVPDGLFSKIDMDLQQLRDEDTQVSLEMPLEILSDLLSDENWYLRQWVIQHVMDVMKADTPVGFIVTALNDTQPEVCLSVLHSCQQLNLTNVAFITTKIAKALLNGQISEQPALHALKLLGKIVIDLRELDKEAVLNIDLEILRSIALDKRWQFRQWAVEFAMSILQKNTPADLFVSALNDTDEKVHSSALRIFAAMGKDRIILVDALVSAISQEQVEDVLSQALELQREAAYQSLKLSSEFAAKNADRVAQFHRTFFFPGS
jgi:hypothetical protein